MASADTMSSFEVVRADLRRTRFVDEPVPAPEPGAVLTRVEAVGLTANNISYAVFGDMLGYWRFFPAEGPWGRIPAWGFARVVASAHDTVAEGNRLFGYLPIASHLVLQPSAPDGGQLVDTVEHRADLPPAYNSYRLVDEDPLHDPAREGEQMLLWPLFFTGFVLDRFLATNDGFGTDTVVLSCASSKTAVSTAYCLADRGGVTVIGLTSEANADLVRSLDPYDLVVTYDEVDQLPRQPAVYVDFAGDTAVRAAVHHHYGDRLAHSAMVGGTHWERTDAVEVPGPDPAFFFAPDHWGPEAEQALPAAWRGFLAGVDEWLRLESRSGTEAVRAAYLQTLEGRVGPDVGLILSL